MGKTRGKGTSAFKEMSVCHNRRCDSEMDPSYAEQGALLFPYIKKETELCVHCITITHKKKNLPWDFFFLYRIFLNLASFHVISAAPDTFGGGPTGQADNRSFI